MSIALLALFNISVRTHARTRTSSSHEGTRACVIASGLPGTYIIFSWPPKTLPPGSINNIIFFLLKVFGIRTFQRRPTEFTRNARRRITLSRCGTHKTRSGCTPARARPRGRWRRSTHSEVSAYYFYLTRYRPDAKNRKLETARSYGAPPTVRTSVFHTIHLKTNYGAVAHRNVIIPISYHL